MGNTPNLCCKRKSNIDIDLIDINNQEIMNNVQKLIKIQSQIRKHLIRKKTKKTLLDFPFSMRRVPGVIVDKNYLSKSEKINQKLSDLISNLEKLELNDREELLSINSELQDFALIYPDNTFYKGFLNKSWKKEGFGLLHLPDGSKYEGYFKNDKMNGKGRLINSEGFYYEGEFKSNRADGYGKYVNLNGTSYKGFWRDDKQNGYGEEFFSDGSKYEGNYFNGKKTGKGKFNWPGNSFYEGDFENNDLQGFGEYHWKDGRIYFGDWKKNKMEGIGLFVWPDNKKYIGSYRNDKKNGYGIFSWPDGKCFEGEWAEGKQNGFGIFKSKYGIKIGEWRNGEKLRWIDPNKSLDEYKLLKRILKEKKIEFSFEKAETTFKKEFDIMKKGFGKETVTCNNIEDKKSNCKNSEENIQNHYLNLDNKKNEKDINNNNESTFNNTIHESMENKETSTKNLYSSKIF